MEFPDILIRKPLPLQAELMEFPDIPTGNSPRRQLQGPRPTPLTISKDSLKIRKPLLPQAELMEFPDIPTGKSPRRQLLGPRPSPIRRQKDSHKIRKPPLPPLQPLIIYSVSPKVIHNPLSDLMSLVQHLTGSSSSASSSNTGSKDTFTCNQGDMVSPAARLAAIEKARSSQPKKVLVQHQSGEAGGYGEGIVEVGDAVDGPNSTSHGILSPGPAALSPIPASFFSSPATADPSTQQTTPDHLLTDDRGAMENFRELSERSIFTQDHTNDKYVQSKEDGHAILHSVSTLSPLFMKKSGLGLTDPPKDEAWHSVVHMELANNKLSELPLSPSSPELRVLMLQGNADLTRVPNTFFSKMPLLTVLDLSHTSLRELPDSLFELEQLREMYLKGCERFMKLSPKITKLKNLENLDLDGTQIIYLPEEIQELTNLQSLFLCFYEYRGRKGKQYTRSTIIPSEVISKLKWLKHLSIDVNPDDERWYENVRDIIPEILGLEHLHTLSLYIPHLELLKFIPDRILWDDFRLIVGRHMQRIISSTPSTIEAKFKQCGSSLKFVNGEDFPDEIKRLVRHSKALFLERHKTIKHLSEFKMMNLEQLRVCMLAECREMQTIVDGRQSNRGNDIFSHLLYLYVYHMKSLRSIWEGLKPHRSLFGMLKSLVLQNCPELTTVFTMDFLGNLSLLKELIVKDCPKMTTLISDGSFKGEIFLPKLRKIMLLHLPELVTISNSCHIAPSLNGMAVYDCPKLQSLSKSELLSQTLKVIYGEIKWWDQLQWSKEEWGTSQRPSKFDHIFSLIDNQADVMTQIGNDGDDIDDDADMMPPETLFVPPKQNGNSFDRSSDTCSQASSVNSTLTNSINQRGNSIDNQVDIMTQIGNDQTGNDGDDIDDDADYMMPSETLFLPLEQNADAFSSDTCSHVSCVTDSTTQRGNAMDNKVDIMTQIGNDGDDINDDAVDMAPPHTLFEDPKQNADSFSSAKKNAERFTFRTKSEVDILEDGYKWRKYGWNEASCGNPRSYYKCTHEGCSVKKKVERSADDQTIVETVYKGIHTHPRPQENRSLHKPQSSEMVSSVTQYPSNDKVDEERSYMHTVSQKSHKIRKPRPLPPLSVSKQSHKIQRPPLPPQAHQLAVGPSQQQQPRPVIIYSISPKVIHVPVDDFMKVVQRLTGPSSPSSRSGDDSPAAVSIENTSPSEKDRFGDVSPAARLVSIEKTSPSEKERFQSGLAMR